jgi:tryptophan synthase alpha chain
MSKVKNAFANKKAFIPFITAGDPDADSTVRFVLAAARAGADLIEIGIPFSDPTAEGPVIQEADTRALAAGMTVHGAFEIAKRVRAEDPEIPLAFMTYLNPVFKYRGDTDGSVPYEPFLAECSELGIDALIITSPERHGGEPAQWYAALAALAERGVTVVIVTDAATADLLVALGARDALAREQKELQ